MAAGIERMLGFDPIGLDLCATVGFLRDRGEMQASSPTGFCVVASDGGGGGGWDPSFEATKMEVSTNER